MNELSLECPHCGNRKLYKHFFKEEVYICTVCRFSFSKDFYFMHLEENKKKEQKKNKKSLYDLTKEI